MPSNWLYIDTNFPAFTGEESMEEKVTSIQDYMYLLVEQLRYTLHNLDLGNMNKTAKERWESAITEPIYAKIEDDEERILQLAIDAGALALRISDSEGNITPETVHTILYGEDTEPKVKPKSVKISHDIYTKYFSKGEKPKEITDTIEKALELYFKNMEDK